MTQGVMYVEILPSTKGIGKAVERDANAAFAGAEKTGSSFFSKVGTWAKRGALAVGGMVTAVGALAVGGGISRALNIEDATAKLKGLGHDTKSVEAIMNDALASVKGTAFGLDAAATTAAAAVASGIRPGKELEGYLRLTADAATIAGVSMEEMGSIMNKVQAKGKAQMEDLNRLTERGIPIMQMLADEYGVTAEEMSDMVSRGEVDSERFRKALEDNVGGAALESGNTTRGAFANMMAALSRLGLAFIGDGLSGAKTFFNEVTVILDGLTERLGPWVEGIQEKLGGAFKMDGFGERFLDGFDRMVDAISSGPLPALFDALKPVLPALMEMAEIVGGALGDAFMELGKALAPVLPMLSEALADAVVQLAPPLTDLLVALLPLVPPLVELLVAITPLVAALVEQLIPAFEWLLEVITPVIEELSNALKFINGDIDAATFVGSLSEVQGSISGTVGFVLDLVGALHDFVGGLYQFIQDTAVNIYGFVLGIQTFFTDLGVSIAGIWQSIVSTVQNAITAVYLAVQSVLSTIQSVWAGMWGNMAGWVSSAWGNIVSAVSGGVSSVMSFINGLPGQVLGALGALGGMLFSVGQNMIQGLINGVGSMIGNAVSAVKNVGGAMLEGVQSFLGIHSPSRVFRDEVGKMVGLGLLAGIEDDAIAGRIDTAVNHLVAVPDGLSPTGGRSMNVTQVFEQRQEDIRVLVRKAGRELESQMIT